MSSRIAQLAARLDALSRIEPEEPELRVVRAGFGLAIPLPAAVTRALALREGDRVELSLPEQGALIIVSCQGSGGQAPGS